MNLQPDDPRLTAYALGELGADESALIERELRLNDDARCAVEEIRAAAANLGAILKSEEMPGLDSARRERIVEFTKVAPAVSNNSSNILINRNLWVWRSVSLIAASLVIGVTIAIIGENNINPRLGPSKSTVASETPDRVLRRINTTDSNSPAAGGGDASTAHENLRKSGEDRLDILTKEKWADDLSSLTKRADGELPAGSVSADPKLKDQTAAANDDKNAEGFTRGVPATPNPARPAADATKKELKDSGELKAKLAAPKPSAAPAEKAKSTDSRNDEFRAARPGTAGRGLETGAGAPAGTRTGEKKSDVSDGKESKTTDRDSLINEELLESNEKIKSELESNGYLGNSVPFEKRARLARERSQEQPGGERYKSIVENRFIDAREEPVSTVSVDVDTASYSNARRYLVNNTLPPPDSVRVEEFINYFPYRKESLSSKDTPFSVKSEVATCPWNPEHRLLRIAIQGHDITPEQRKPSNLVFLVDVSGSMSDQNKLPLLKQSLKLLVGQLTEDDRVSIVTYAGRSDVALNSTNGTQKDTILNSIERLEAGGGTNGGAGIQKAYDTAVANFITKGTNRVILATDGDFNVGTTDHAQLMKLIEEKAKSGVFLSVLGFGTGNIKEDTMEQLADRGNGNFAYIDNINEGRKVLVEQMSGTLSTIAKDVKLQIKFDPAEVKEYRLIGYENRKLAAQDFNNDKKDAGDVGAGHHVVMFYEWVPVQSVRRLQGLALQQQAPPGLAAKERADRGKICNIDIRYKHPANKTSQLLEFAAYDAGNQFMHSTSDFQFSAAVAAFALLLRDSEYKGSVTADLILELAQGNLYFDPSGYRKEFITLVTAAKELLTERAGK